MCTVIAVASILFLLIILQQSAVAGQHSGNYATYTNTELAYSVNYPSDYPIVL
jgi:hypothetical protein